jgi:hypothetical protein
VFVAVLELLKELQVSLQERGVVARDAATVEFSVQKRARDGDDQ